jgi:hypothetical protein
MYHHMIECPATAAQRRTLRVICWCARMIKKKTQKIQFAIDYR